MTGHHNDDWDSALACGTLPIHVLDDERDKYQAVYMGWDPREEKAYEVAAHSLRAHASGNVALFALKLDRLREAGILTRPVERTKEGKLWCPISEAPMSTEFAISRFAVPFIQENGLALFTDSDVLWQADVAELFALADDRYAIQVVKHQQSVTPLLPKMDGRVQTAYMRKNWSSVMLWNLNHPGHKRLTKEMLNTLPGRDLHRFCWLEDGEIGSLPQEWNVLVEPVAPKLLHYTLGGPWLPEYRDCQYSTEWHRERAALDNALDPNCIMTDGEGNVLPPEEVNHGS